jgi:hypothetical protein
MPTEEAPATPYDSKVIDNSADLAERLSRGRIGHVLFEDGINASRPGTHSNLQSTPTPLSRRTMPRTRSKPTESESDFGFKLGGEADEHPFAKVSARGDGGFNHGLHASMADRHDKGAEDTKQPAADVEKKKKKVDRSKEPWADGGSGYDSCAAMAALQNTDVEGVKGVVKEEDAKEVVMAEAK